LSKAKTSKNVLFISARPADQLFGILARSINSMDCLLDPDSIIDVIMSTMKKPALESFLKSCDVSAALLPAVRDWQAWHNDLRLTISGALLVDATAMHFFLLTDRESRNHRPMLEHGSAECLLSKTSGKFYQTQTQPTSTKVSGLRGTRRRRSRVALPLLPRTMSCARSGGSSLTVSGLSRLWC
jgi:hypothetical protein